VNIPSDGFNGDNAALVDSIKSLLALDDRGVLVPNGVCGLARQLLESAAERLKFAACSPPGTGSDSLDCILGVGGFASFGPLDAQPAAHLTIPGALEWDGDNGTHGADGESRAHGESSELELLRKKTAVTMGVGCGAGQLFVHGDSESIHAAKAIVLECERLRAQLANTEQSRRSFFDLSQDLEKRLAERDELLQMFIDNSDDGDVVELSRNALSTIAEPESFPCWSCHAPVTMANRADADGNCPHCEAELDLEDWPKAQADKPKTCIECDQPYCHGVCVERGDQDYDRDQAAKGGEQ